MHDAREEDEAPEENPIVAELERESRRPIGRAGCLALLLVFLLPVFVAWVYLRLSSR